MEDRKKTELFEQMPVPKAVATLAIPTMLSSLVMVLYNLADTYFVGMLNVPAQTSAVTLAASVLLAFNAVNNLFGVGCSSMMSRAMGRKDYDTVARSSAFGFYCSILGGLLISIGCTLFKDPLLALLGAKSDAATAEATAQYMLWTVSFGAIPAILNVVMAYMVRAEGAALHASVGTMSGCLLNIVLDPIFIMPWGFNMGAAGAGLATFLSNCVACAYFFVLLYVKRKSTLVCIRPKMFACQREIVRGVFIVGLPASIQNLLNVTGMTLLNRFTAGYGTTAVAAMGIAYKIYMVPLQVALGLSQGIMPLISYNFASGNIPRLKKSFMFTAKITFTALLAVAAGYFAFAGGLVRMFMDNEEVIAYGTTFLRGFSLGLPFICLDFMGVGVFQAVGLGQYALLFAILRKIVFEIPGLLLLNLIFPLYGLPYAQAVAEILLSGIAVIILARLFRKWDEKKPAQGMPT